MMPYATLDVTLRTGEVVTYERVDGLWGVVEYQSEIPSKVAMHPHLLDALLRAKSALEGVEFACDVLATRMMDKGLYEDAVEVSNVSARAADALRN